jgi:hypothetical protein
LGTDMPQIEGKTDCSREREFVGGRSTPSHTAQRIFLKKRGPVR